jgi:hypothetical protein
MAFSYGIANEIQKYRCREMIIDWSGDSAPGLHAPLKCSLTSGKAAKSKPTVGRLQGVTLLPNRVLQRKNCMQQRATLQPNSPEVNTVGHTRHALRQIAYNIAPTCCKRNLEAYMIQMLCFRPGSPIRRHVWFAARRISSCLKAVESSSLIGRAAFHSPRGRCDCNFR